MRKIAILSYNNAALFELGCAVELFALPRPETPNWYASEVVCFDPGPHESTAGVLLTTKLIDNLDEYDTLVIPSWPTNITRVAGLLAEQIQDFHRRGNTILSFCSGAFLLASLGLLDNRDATTHWRYAEKFKNRFPSVNYVGDVLYVYDGQLGCSAGSAAAIDLGFALIRFDYGSKVAAQVARRMVMSPHRQGGQAQYVESPKLHSPPLFQQSLDWALRNIRQKFTIDTLAQKSAMSRRSFDRKFRLCFKQTPKQWLTVQRLNLAKQLLEEKKSNIEQIADLAGFDNATNLRHHFRNTLGVSPRQYRDQFADN